VPIRQRLIGSEDWFRSGWNAELYTLITISLPTWLYFAFLEASPWQATVGKRLLKLETLEKGRRDRLSFLQAFIRTLIKLAPWEIAHLTNNLPVPLWYDPNPDFRAGFILVPLLLVIYIVVAFVTPDRQSVHDLLAQSLVIRRGEPAARG
jgi:uncharacterized RDD family membrane protein YckC